MTATRGNHRLRARAPVCLLQRAGCPLLPPGLVGVGKDLQQPQLTGSEGVAQPSRWLGPSAALVPRYFWLRSPLAWQAGKATAAGGFCPSEETDERVSPNRELRPVAVTRFPAGAAPATPPWSLCGLSAPVSSEQGLVHVAISLLGMGKNLLWKRVQGGGGVLRVAGSPALLRSAWEPEQGRSQKTSAGMCVALGKILDPPSAISVAADG